MTATTTLRLEEVYIGPGQNYLCTEKVAEYRASGIASIIDQMKERQRDSHFVRIGRLGPSEFLYLIDFCHRSRALLDLGQREVQMIKPPPADIYNISDNEMPPLLVDAPFLGLAAYREWYEDFVGETLDGDEL